MKVFRIIKIDKHGHYYDLEVYSENQLKEAYNAFLNYDIKDVLENEEEELELCPYDTEEKICLDWRDEELLSIGRELNRWVTRRL